jgi:hypothetical protein
VGKIDTRPLTVQIGRWTEVKLTSQRCRDVMLRMKIRTVEDRLGVHKILLAPEKEVESSVQRADYSEWLAQPRTESAR